MEAMSCGAAVVAGDTAPVREVIGHDETGRLVDFFDGASLVEAVCALLEDDGRAAKAGTATPATSFARATI